MARHARRFIELYCEQNGISPEDYGRHLTARVLHPPFNWVGRWLLATNGTIFDADLQLVRHCGILGHRKALESELREFSSDYRNRTFRRRFLRCRLSTRRLRRVFRTTLRQAASNQ